MYEKVCGSPVTVNFIWQSNFYHLPQRIPLLIKNNTPFLEILITTILNLGTDIFELVLIQNTALVIKQRTVFFVLSENWRFRMLIRPTYEEWSWKFIFFIKVYFKYY